MRNSNYDGEVLDFVFDRVFADIAQYASHLEPLPLEEVRSTFKDLSRSAGNCYLGSYKSKKDIPDSELFASIEHLSGDGYVPPFKVAFRSQCRKHKAKRRVIFVAPGPFVMIEKMFWYPFQEALASSFAHSWWNVGFDWIKNAGYKYSYWLENDSVYSSDFEDFDFCAPPSMIRSIMYRIGQLFNMNALQLKIWEGITNTYCKHRISYLNEILTSYGGIISGVAGTNILGTIIGKIIVDYVHEMKGKIRPKSQHSGDDMFMESVMSLNDFIDAVSSLTTFSISKTKSKKGVYWLGFKWFKDRWILQDRDKRWAQLFFPDRKHSFVARLQALLLNCNSDLIRHDCIKILKDWNTLMPHDELSEIMDLNDINPNLSVLDIELIFKRNHRLD